MFKRKKPSGAEYAKRRKIATEETQKSAEFLDKFLQRGVALTQDDTSLNRPTADIDTSLDRPSADIDTSLNRPTVDIDTSLNRPTVDTGSTSKENAEVSEEEISKLFEDSQERSLNNTESENSLVDEGHRDGVQKDFANYIITGKIIDVEGFIREFDHEYLCGESNIDQNRDSDLRHFSVEWFYRILPDGTRIRREWLVYSPSRNVCYCIPCWLFPEKSRAIPHSVSSFATAKGFSKWRKLNPRVKDHESSASHRECYLRFLDLRKRIKKGCTIRHCLFEQAETVEKERREILYRAIKVIKYLARQNQAFRGHRGESNASITLIGQDGLNHGNFLEAMALISEFDPFLAKYMSSLKKNEISYLSKTIQNELILLMGNMVRRSILTAVKDAGAYGLMVDTTPDKSHEEQMSQILRYVTVDFETASFQVKESFIDFVPIKGERKTAEVIFHSIVDKLQSDGIDPRKCVAQSYDNAAVMAGELSGVQTRFQEVSPSAVFINCSNHSLNLCCVAAVKAEVDIVTFFSRIDNVYAFFSNSTIRWQTLNEKGVRLKRSCPTRWSSHHDAISVIRENLITIIETLKKMKKEPYNSETRSEASRVISEIKDFKFIAFILFWNEVLSPINRCQKILQSPQTSILVASESMGNVASHIQQQRSNIVERSVDEAKNICEKLGICVESKRKRKVKKMPGELADDTVLTLEETVRRTMYSALDHLHREIAIRSNRLMTVSKKFHFLLNFDSETDLTQSANAFVADYPDFLNSDLLQEITDFRVLVKPEAITSMNADFLMEQLLTFGPNAFPNLLKAVRILLTAGVSVASCERSFSKLKILANDHRTSMIQDRLSALAILSIEKEATNALAEEDVLREFFSKKRGRGGLNYKS